MLYEVTERKSHKKDFLLCVQSSKKKTFQCHYQQEVRRVSSVALKSRKQQRSGCWAHPVDLDEVMCNVPKKRSTSADVSLRKEKDGLCTRQKKSAPKTMIFPK